MDQVSSNLSRRLKIRSRSLLFQREKYKRAWGQLENTHSGRAPKLSWNSRAWFAKNFRSVSVAARRSIGERDGVVLGQEYNEGREGAFQSSVEAAATQSSQELNRGSAEATRGKEG